MLFSCSNIYAQKKIKLTNATRTRIIREGMRICYVKKGDYEMTKGFLKTIDKSFIVVNNQTIAIEDLTAIGRKRGGSGFFQFFCGFVAGGIFIDAVSPTDNTPSCNGCQTTTTVDQGAITAEYLMSGAFIALGVNSILSNTPRKLSKWKLEVID